MITFKELGLALKAYSISIGIPIALSVANILYCGIFDFQAKYGFMGNFKHIWLDYYVCGHIWGIPSYVCHLILILISIYYIKKSH